MNELQELLNGLTFEEALEQGKLIPLDTTRPNWVQEIEEMLATKKAQDKNNFKHTQPEET